MGRAFLVPAKAGEKWKGADGMERTDLKTQLAEVAERIRTMREIMGLSLIHI